MNTEDARKSLDYLEKQIENVSLRLQESENELNAFRVDNVSIDIEAESLSYLEQLNNVQTKLEQLYLKRVEYQSLYSENNPLSQTLENQVNELNSQREDIEREIRALPSQQQTLINLTRQVAVNQKIFEDLSSQKRGFGGEIQLTDSLLNLVDTPGLFGVEFDGNRYDCGNKLGFIEANLNFGLNDTEIKSKLRSMLRKL